MATFSATARTLTELAVCARDARKAAGMSQSQLAAAAHLNRSWVSLFESGHAPNASLSKVLAMFDVLGISMRLSYPIPDPEPGAGEGCRPPSPTSATMTSPEEAPSNQLDAPATLDPVALAAARAQREIHRARARDDDLTRGPADG